MLHRAGAAVEERTRVFQAGLQGFDERQVVGQDAVEVPRLDQVVAHEPEGAEPREGSIDLFGGEALAPRECVPVEGALPLQCTAQAGRGVVEIGAALAHGLEGSSFAREAAPDLGAQEQRQAQAALQFRDPGARGGVRAPLRLRVHGEGDHGRSHTFEELEPVGRADVEGARGSGARDAEAGGSGGHGEPALGALPRQPLEEADRGGATHGVLMFQRGEDRLDFEEAADPARRERDLALEGRLAARDDAEALGAHEEVQGKGRAHAAQGRPELRSEVHVRRAAVEDVAVEGVEGDVEPRVDAAAGAEGLEAQVARVRGDDRVGLADQPLAHRGRDVEARLGGVPDGEQSPGEGDRRVQSPAHEVRQERAGRASVRGDEAEGRVLWRQRERRGSGVADGVGERAHGAGGRRREASGADPEASVVESASPWRRVWSAKGRPTPRH